MTPATATAQGRTARIASAAGRLLTLLGTVVLGIVNTNAVEAARWQLASATSWTHMALGAVFLVLALCHAWSKRHWFMTEMLPPRNWYMHADQRVMPLYLLCYIVVLGSTLLLAAGVAAMMPWHCGAGLMLAVVGVFHFVLKMPKLMQP